MGFLDYIGGLFKRGKNPQYIASSGVPISAAGDVITQDAAMKLSAFYSCVSLYADIFTVARPEMFRLVGDLETRDMSGLDWVIRKKPNSTQTASFFWSFALTSMQIRGAFYALIVRGGNGEVRELVPLHPDRIQIVLEEADIGNGIGARRIVGFRYLADYDTVPLAKRDLFYIFGRSLDGITPVSPLQYMADSLGIAIRGGDYLQHAYKNGIKPSLIITMPEKMNPEARRGLSDALTHANSGGNVGRVMVLDQGAKPENISISPADMQIIESANFSITDIARFFRIDPRFLYVPGQAAGWSTVEMMSQEFVRYSLLPWGDRIEDAINTQLVREVDQGKRYAAYNYDELLKADYSARMRAYGDMIRAGIISPNEARQHEGWNPYDGGERYYMQAQMMPVNQLGRADSGNEN